MVLLTSRIWRIMLTASCEAGVPGGIVALKKQKKLFSVVFLSLSVGSETRFNTSIKKKIAPIFSGKEK